METKLTIRLRKNVVDKAKDYAFQHKTSLSKMVENYLEAIVSEKDKKEDITPLVESLSGVIHIKDDIDYQSQYSDFLANKYK
jgi:hypothetical protein